MANPLTHALSDLSWPQVPRTAVLVVPLGATEQHGTHMPLGTDSHIAQNLAESLCADERFVLAPTMPYSASGEHQHFAGTLSIGHEALLLVLLELVRSATETFRAVIIVNGHGGNLTTLGQLQECCRVESRDILTWSPSLPLGGDHHAGHTETSVMLHLSPTAVGADPSAGPQLTAELLERMRTDGVAAVSPSGVLGNPAGASAQAGSVIVATWVTALQVAATAFLESLM
jgi:mycofactocin precursor peptide peptidase